MHSKNEDLGQREYDKCGTWEQQFNEMLEHGSWTKITETTAKKYWFDAAYALDFIYSQLSQPHEMDHEKDEKWHG